MGGIIVIQIYKDTDKEQTTLIICSYSPVKLKPEDAFL